MCPQTAQNVAIPEDFLEQVKDALANLWDFPYLRQHPLWQELEAAVAGSETGQVGLRQQILAAVQSLKPNGNAVPTPQTRPYYMLNLHYVEGLTVQQAAHELGISPRQAHRDLRRGEENVAATLWTLRSYRKKRAIQLSSIQEEIGRLETHLGSIDLRLLVERAQSAVQRLATQRGIRFQVEMPPEPVVISCDQTVALQVLVNTLSPIVQQVQQGTVSLVLRSQGKSTSLTVRCVPTSPRSDGGLPSEVTERLIRRLNWTIEQTVDAGGVHATVLQMEATGPTVLVIDDNEGLVELLERYLTHHACRVVAATAGSDGLRLAQEIGPDAILLDIMMPQVDGWEILQVLHNHPSTTNIPVVVCTVFNDPELAYSLGASLFLPKPVSRDSVLAVLRQLGIV